MANKDYRPSTLLAVIKAIQSDESLTKGRKTNFTTGIKTFCRCVGRDPSEIDANPVALRALRRFAKPKLIGIGAAHFRNSFSRLKKSLEYVGIPVDRRRNMPLSPAWEALLSPLARDKRADLRKLAGRCSALGIEPDALTQQVFEDFTHFLEQQSIQHNVRERGHRARRAWNEEVALKGASFPKIANPFDRGDARPSLDDFPASLVEELRNFRNVVAKPKISGGLTPRGPLGNARDGVSQRISGGRRKPLSPVTAAGYAGNFVLLAGYLVKDGVPIDQFTSLHALMDPELIWRGLERMQADVLSASNEGKARLSAGRHARAETMHPDPNKPLPIVTATAFAALSIAKFINVDPETLAAIKAIAAETRVPRQSGLTARNKARLRQLDDPHAKGLLLNLPAAVFKRHASNIRRSRPTSRRAKFRTRSSWPCCWSCQSASRTSPIWTWNAISYGRSGKGRANGLSRSPGTRSRTVRTSTANLQRRRARCWTFTSARFGHS